MMKIGDIVKFGKFDWRVLEIESDRVLLLTEEIIEKRPYHPVFEEVTWKTSEMRAYLNSDFYHQFTSEEQQCILKVTNVNIRNPWYETLGGEDTDDYIFLLDVVDVVCKYFGDSSNRLYNRGPKERYWFGKKDENNIKRLAKFKGNDYWWWTRTPGRNLKTAVYIHGNPIGCVGINGNNVFFQSYEDYKNGGIRPALWKKI